MKLQKYQQEYYSYIEKNHCITITVLDLIHNSNYEHIFLLIHQDVIYGIIIKQSLYLTVSSDEALLVLLNYIKEKKMKFYFVYGKAHIIEKFKKYNQQIVEIENKCLVMELPLNNAHFINKNSEIEYRKSSLQDFNHLKKLQYLYHIEEVYAETYYPKQSEMKAYQLLLANRIHFAGYLNNHAVTKVNVNAQSDIIIQLGGVYTLDRYRGKGYAEGCVKSLLAYAQSNKYEKAQLFVKLQNIPAICLYEKIGFKKKMETTILYNFF